MKKEETKLASAGREQNKYARRLHMEARVGELVEAPALQVVASLIPGGNRTRADKSKGAEDNQPTYRNMLNRTEPKEPVNCTATPRTRVEINSNIHSYKG
jgi:hypothetical protein